MASSSTLPATPQLPAERFFRVSLFLLLFTAILTLIGTGKIDIFTSAVAMAALLYRVRRWWYGHGPELQARTATILVLGYLLFFPVDMFFLSRSLAVNSPNPPLYAALISSVHFLLFILLVRLYSARTDRDAHFLVMLAFAALLASAVLTVDTAFLFLFFFFLLFAIATYTGLELRRGATGASLPPTHVQRDNEQRLARALGFSAVGVSLGAILCGTVLFFIFPRISAGYLGKTSFNPSLLSGFTDQVELGQIGQIKRLVRRDHMLASGDVRPHVRPGPGGDQNRLGVHTRAVRQQPHRARILDDGAAFNQGDVIPLKRITVGGF